MHHSLFFLDATGASRERDASDPLAWVPWWHGRRASRGRWSVAVAVGIAGRAWVGRYSVDDDPVARVAGSLGGWALGGRALELPSGLAFFVAKGSDLVLSTHFHPSGKVEREKSTVGLYFASSPPTQAFTTIQLPPIFGVFEGLDIPADEGHYTIKDSFVIPIDVRAFSVGAHAHYLGKQMRLTATLPNGDSEDAAADRRLGFLVAGAVSLRGVRVAAEGHAARRRGDLRQHVGKQAQPEPSAGSRHVG